MAHDVFITYSHVDKAVTDAICAGLEKDGIRCWYAPRDIRAGEEWAAAITNAISASRVMVLVYTDASNHSKQVLREINQALDAELVLIPFRLTENRPSASMKYYLSTVHWLDAIDEPLEKSIASLSRMIRSILHPDNGLPARADAEEYTDRKQKGKAGSKWLTPVLCAAAAVLTAAILLLAGVFRQPEKAGEPAQSAAPPTAEATETTKPENTETPVGETEAPQEEDTETETAMPVYATEGQAFSVTVHRPGNTGRYVLDVWKDTLDGTDGALIHRDSLTDEECSIELTAEQMTNTDRLHIRLSGYQANAGQDRLWDLPVIPQAGEGVRIQLAEEDPEAQGKTVLINEDVRLRVVADGGAPIQAVRLFDGNGFRFDSPGPDGAYETSVAYGESGSYVVFAQVILEEWRDEYNGLDEDPRSWITTEPVLITAAATGESVGRTAITYADTDSREWTVTRGDFVTVRLEDAEGAENYWVDVACDTEETNQDRPFDFAWEWTDSELHEARIYTAGLPAGSYRIDGHASTPGWYAYDTAEDESLRLKVTEITSDEPIVILRTSQTEFNTGDQIYYTACAAGAAWIDLFFDYQNGEDWSSHMDGDSFAVPMEPYWNSGSYTLLARAWYPVYDEQHEPVMETDEAGNAYHKHEYRNSSPITLDVHAPGGEIRVDNYPDLPHWLDPGSGVEFMAATPENVEWMSIYFTLENGPESRELPAAFQHEGIRNETVPVLISWEDLQSSGAATGWVLAARAFYNRRGFETLTWEKRIPILDPQGSENAGAVLSFTGREGEQADLARNEEIGLIVTEQPGRTPAEGEETAIQSVRFFNTYGFEETGPQEDGTFRIAEGYERPGSYSIYALVTYMPRNEDREGTEEDPRVWYPTNVVTINVK